MHIEEKIAILKMAGFEIGNWGRDFEWLVRDKDHLKYRGIGAFKSQSAAWQNAWEFFQGDKTQEIDEDAWGTR